jgi:hypothetical protein
VDVGPTPSHGRQQRVLCADKISRGGPRGDRTGQVARTSRGMAALDRGGAQAGPRVAAAVRQLRAAGSTAPARMGSGRSCSWPAGAVARGRIWLRDHHLFRGRAGTRAVGGSRAGYRNGHIGDPVPASTICIFGDGGPCRPGGRICDRHGEARNHRPSGAVRTGVERRACGLRRGAGRARAFRSHCRAPRAHRGAAI